MDAGQEAFRVAISFLSVAGIVYSVQCSVDLQNWESHGMITGSGGVVQSFHAREEKGLCSRILAGN